MVAPKFNLLLVPSPCLLLSSFASSLKPDFRFSCCIPSRLYLAPCPYYWSVYCFYNTSFSKTIGILTLSSQNPSKYFHILVVFHLSSGVHNKSSSSLRSHTFIVRVYQLCIYIKILGVTKFGSTQGSSSLLGKGYFKK